MKNVKSMGDLHSKNMANFEVFHKGISSSINLFFQKSVQLSRILRREKNQAHYFLSNSFNFPQFYILPTYIISSALHQDPCTQTRIELSLSTIFFGLRTLKGKLGSTFPFVKCD